MTLADWPLDLLAVLTLGLGGAVLGLAGLLERDASRWLRPAAVLAGLFGLTAATLAVLRLPVIVWAPPAVLAAADLLPRIIRRLPDKFGRLVYGLFTARRLHAAILLTIAPLLAFAWGYHINALTEGPYQPALETNEGEPATTIQRTDLTAVTDRGRYVPLYLNVSTASTASPTTGDESKLAKSMALRVIRTGGPELSSNCHGWVFTGNRFCLMGEDIPKILEDNGYQMVSQPRPGDLIVYTDGVGAVLHSGVVRMADGELTLIESKWGNLGRYLHSPADQPYSQGWTYYRSARGSHLLACDWGRLEPASPGRLTVGSGEPINR